ncbi:MAG: tetratricopeptide repeat protein [Chitinophagaceae bacterium]|nr:tetratricopeptide repeat protein [Chitinophagaceae bacterium]
MHRIILLYLLFLLVSSCQFFSSTSKKTSQEGTIVFPETSKISTLIEDNPKDASLYFKRGLILREIEKDSLAMLDFQKAISLDSTKAPFYSALGDLLFDHKDITGSLGWIKKAIELDPEDKVAHLKLAKLFLFTAEYPKAFTEINTVLRSDVYNTEAYFLKGMCYKNMKDTNKAISSFQTSVQADPKNVDSYMQLAILHEAKKDPLALEYYENAYKANPSNLDPLYGKAMYWQNQGKFEEAKKIFTRMIVLDRNYPVSFYNMGWMLLQQDSIDKAIRQFNIAIEVNPDYTEAYHNRGLCYEIQHNKNAAIADYNQALNFNPDFAPSKEALKRIQQ